MEKERKAQVEVSIEGRIFTVNRYTLADQLTIGNKVIAPYLGKRPGEPVGTNFRPNENLSIDVFETMLTIREEQRKGPLSRKVKLSNSL